MSSVLFYDGDCDFCRWWVARWGHVTGDRVRYIPFQRTGDSEFQDTRFVSGMLPESGHQAPISVRLLDPDGTVYEGAEAVFRALARAPRQGGFLWAYRRVPAFAELAEWIYRRVAGCRGTLSRLIRRF